MIAGGVESMSRAPFVMGKSETAFSRTAEIYDTTIGWRFVNPIDEEQVRHRFYARDRRKRGGRFSGFRGRIKMHSLCEASSGGRRRRRTDSFDAKSCR